MRAAKLARFIQTFVLGPIALTAGAASIADCQTAKPARSVDIAAGQADALLKSMVAACKAQNSDQFFKLQTEDANRVFAKNSQAEKYKLYEQYCASTTGAVSKLGGDLGAAIHSVGPYKNRMKCGMPSSYWYVNSKNGELVLRVEVAVESGRLKIDTQ